MIKSSNGSSGLTVVKFSCKIPIFFSLSHPAGLKGKKSHFSYSVCININNSLDYLVVLVHL